MSFFFFPQRAPQQAYHGSRLNCPQCGFRSDFLSDPPDMFYTGGVGYRMPTYARDWCVTCTRDLHYRLQAEKLVDEHREKARREAEAAEAEKRRVAAQKKAAFEAEQEEIRKHEEYEALLEAQAEEEAKRKLLADQKAKIKELRDQLAAAGDVLTDSDSSDSDGEAGDGTVFAWSQDTGPDP